MAKKFRRKAPRRDYEGRIGLLHKGQMLRSFCIQVGEGGALVQANPATNPIAIGDNFVSTIFFPNIGGITSKAQCVYISENGDFGISFDDLNMKFKKRVREYVSRRKV